MNTSPHKPGTSTREQFLLNSAFFLLFPGFFYYHTLLGTGTTGAFLGGYFLPISIDYMVPLFLVYYRRLRLDPRRRSAIEMHCSLFKLYFLAVVLVNAVAGANRAIVVNHLACILLRVNTFIMYSFSDFEHRQFRLMAFASLAVIPAIALSFSVNGVFYLGALGIARDAESLRRSGQAAGLLRQAVAAAGWGSACARTERGQRPAIAPPCRRSMITFHQPFERTSS